MANKWNIRRRRTVMYRRIGLLAIGLAVAIMLNAGPAKAQAPSVAPGGVQASKPIPAPAPAAVNNQTAVACNVCFTCGGDWPVFAGAWSSSAFGATERGSGCFGALAGSGDHDPFLCCR